MSLIITNSQHYTNIANAIREKNGANTLYKPKEMSEALRALLFNKQLIERTIENLNDDTIVSLGPYALAGCENLKSVELNNCTSIGVAAFLDCVLLENIILPEVSVIQRLGPCLFNLKIVNMPKLLEAPAHFLEDCSATDLIFPALQKANEGAFSLILNLKNIDFPSLTETGRSAFGGNLDLETANLPNLLTVGPYCFQEDTNLLTINAPKITTIAEYAFLNCSSLTDFNFSQVEYIGENAFQQTAISEITAPKCTYVGDYAFASNSNLETVNFPSLAEINDSTFSYCTKLKNVNLPGVVSFRGPCAFMGASSLEELILPSYNLGGADFSGCTSLKKIDLPNVSAFYNHETFWSCTSLETIILRYYSLVEPDQPSIVTLSEVPEAYFYGTPILDDPNKGFIYVPKVVEEYYKNYTNWNLIANKIRAIEDYPEVLGGAE